MAIDVVAETVIQAPIDRVAGYAMDPANETVWIGGISESEVLTPGPLGKGSRTRRHASFMGRGIDYVLEVTEYDPPRLLAMRSVQAPFPMVVTYEFRESGPGATAASIRIEGGPGGVMGLLSPLMGGQVKGNINGDLRRLKGIMEGGGAAA